jgi:hypothetical protein
MKDSFPKILVASPTSINKDYCFDQWIDNVFSFTYPNFDVVMFDNTNDDGKYADEITKRTWDKYGKKLIRFKAYNSLKINGVKINSLCTKLALSHNDCRDFFLGKNYDYLLHLESDIFPPKDVIERLLYHKKNIIGAGYHIYDGIKRTLLVYKHLELAPNKVTAKVSTPDDDILIMNGDCIKVAQIGLGCTLLSRKLLEKIKFRYEPENPSYPDTFFSNDCHHIGVPIYCDTSFICRHENRTWGIIGLDFN